MNKYFQNKKLFISLVIICLVALFLIKKATIDNEDFLIIATGGSSNISKPYLMALERIYDLSQRKKIGDKFANYILNEKNVNFHDTYIRILGVIGKKDSDFFLVKPYVKYQNDKNNKSIIYDIISSMGLTGNQNYIPILERLLINYEDHKPAVTRYVIARSLYLLTGKRYKLDSGNKITIIDELEIAREIIEKSQNRSRTFEEMVLLDITLRPPKDYKSKNI